MLKSGGLEALQQRLAAALRQDDALAEIKIDLIAAIPGQGRAVVKLKGDARDAERADAALEDLLAGLRRAVATEDEVLAQVACEDPEASPWA